MKARLLEITSDLVAFKTTADRPEEIARSFDYLEGLFSFYPFITGKYEKDGFRSVVWSTHKTLKPKLILNAHIDVVPGGDDLFKMKERGGKIYGRGVSDMKFSLAVFAVALEGFLKDKKASYPIAVMVTSDEERGGFNGVNYLVNEIGYRADVVVIPDGGDNEKMVEMAKGVLHLKIEARGKSAHGSRPWEGDNAIDRLVTGIEKIRHRFPVPKKEVWKTTVNLGKISGGKVNNQICDLAELGVDIRFTEEDTKETLFNLFRDSFLQAKITETVSAEMFRINRDDPHIKLWGNDNFVREHGASDGRFFSGKGIPVTLTKPAGGAVHSDDEWLEVVSLVDFTKKLETYLQKLK